MAKAEVGIGFADVSAAEFIEFNHYTMDQFCDLGAMSVTFACKCDDTFYNVSGDFIVGTEDKVTVTVSGVSEAYLDEDGDVMYRDHEGVSGATLSLPYACVLAIATVTADVDQYCDDYEAFESLVS
jgi:hypothetical protein